MINIILTSTVEHLAANLRKNFKLIFPERNKEGRRFFPDGEVYMRISGVNGLKKKRVVVLHSGAPKPNDGLIELELILQVLKDHRIKSEVFFIYFPYGQQDKIFRAGETNAAENLVKKLINYYKIKKVYIIDPHFGKMPWVKNYPIITLSAVPLLIKKIKKDFGNNILFLSPDRGGEKRTGFAGFNKKRIDSFTVELSPSGAHLEGKVVGVIDDILETGRTLLGFYDCVERSGARQIIALITHSPPVPSIQKIKNKFSKLYLTNTINTKEANIDITDLIVKTMKSRY